MTHYWTKNEVLTKRNRAVTAAGANQHRIDVLNLKKTVDEYG